MAAVYQSFPDAIRRGLGSDQVRRYLSQQGVVLVTNYGDFVLHRYPRSVSAKVICFFGTKLGQL